MEPIELEQRNERRAALAQVALDAYMGATDSADTVEAFTDLLVDLRHWGDRNGIDFDAVADRVRYHYIDETEGMSQA